MKEKILCLGIESSCDETAVALVDSDRNILSHIIYSQIPEHQKYGGVVPELAARAHILAIDEVINSALREANKTINDLDVIAATAGPGLIGGVLVGWMAATGIAQATAKPLVAVNHLEGHALVPRLCATSANDSAQSGMIEFPYLLMLASGGHCQILLVRGVGQYELIGQTLDDSAGEAFDKVSKMLGLGYPGGPVIDMRAPLGDATRFKFPRPLCDKPGCDFSFSGIKTAARTFLEKQNLKNSESGSPPLEGSAKPGVVYPNSRSSVAYYSLPYNQELVEYAKKNRKAGSLPEALLWKEIKSKKINGLDFDRQKIIGNYIVDFFCPDARVVIEVDDAASHDDKGRYDEKRDEYLKSLNLTVIHVTAKEVLKEMNGVIQLLVNHPALRAPLQRRGTSAEHDEIVSTVDNPLVPDIGSPPLDGSAKPGVVYKTPQNNEDQFINDFCASFQAAVVDCITNRLGNALCDSLVVAAAPRTLVVAGGVAKNSAIRAAMEHLAADNDMEFAAPPLNLCTDNGAMIAWAGLENYLIGRVVTAPVAPRPRWPLTEL